MANKLQGTYPLATSLSPSARVLLIDGGVTKEIQPADLAAALGVSGGGPTRRDIVMTASTGMINVTGQPATLTYTPAGAVVAVALDPASNMTSAAISLSAANLTATLTTGEGAPHISRATVGYATGKRYFEAQINTDALGSGAGSSGVGISTAAVGVDTNLGADSLGIGFLSQGNVYNNNALLGQAAQFTTGSRVSVAIDLDAKLIWFRVGAGGWNNSGADPAAGTGGMPYPASGVLYPTITMYHVADSISPKFTSASFTQSVPVGFAPWNAAGAIPVNTALPVITGTAQNGATLTCSNGLWTNSPTSFAFQWIRGASTVIAGATQNAYTQVLADVGSPIKCNVIASNSSGPSAVATAAPTGNVAAAAAPVNTSLPVISGSPQVGLPMTVSDGLWSNSPQSFAYQWYVNNVPKGTNQNTYTPVSGDQNLTSKCDVVATNATGSTTATSASTTNIAVGIVPAALFDFSTSPNAAALTAAGFTFARNSTGTYIDSGGVMRTAGVNIPRYHYDKNGEHGLLIEEQNTNYLYPSIPDTASGRWLSNGTLTANSAVAPDGTTTASTVNMPDGTITPWALNQQNSLQPQTPCFTAWLKGPVGEHVYLFMMNQTAGSTWRTKHTFSGNWERSKHFYGPGANGILGFANVTGQSLTNADVNYGLKAIQFQVWHCQIENGTRPSSVIPTTVGQVTRAGDGLTIVSGTMLTTMQGSTGCFLWEGVMAPYESYQSNEGSLIAGNTSGSWSLQAQVNSGNVMGARAGVVYVGDAGVQIAQGISCKVIGRWGASNYAACVSGYPGMVPNTSDANAPAAATTFGVCYDPRTGTGWINCIIKTLKFYTAALSNAQLQSETAMPGYTMQPALPKGAALLGLTRTLYDFNPTLADVAPGRTGDYKLFESNFYMGRPPDKTRFSDGPDGLIIPFPDGVTTQSRDSTKGLTPYAPGIDGFYLEYEWKQSDNNNRNNAALWSIPKEHNFGLDDFYPDHGDTDPHFERFVEIDGQESNTSGRGVTTSIISHIGIGPGYSNFVSNAGSNGWLDQTKSHTLGYSYEPSSDTVRWYLDDMRVWIARGDGQANAPGNVNNNWEGEYVADVGKQQQFYAIAGAQSWNTYFTGSISGTTMTITQQDSNIMEVGLSIVDQNGLDFPARNTIITAVNQAFVPAGPNNSPPQVNGICTVSISQNVASRGMAAGHPYNLLLKRVRCFTTPVTKNKRLVAYGDSLVFGTGTTNGDLQFSWHPMLCNEIGFIPVNKGNGGERSDQIRVRCLDTNVATLPHDSGIYKYDPSLDVFIFEGGFNNFFQTAGLVEGDFAQMVAAMNNLHPVSSGRYIIMGIPTAEYLDGAGQPNGYLYTGGAGRPLLNAINTNLLNTYGSHFVDIDAGLKAANPGGPGDATDIANGIVPRSLRGDLGGGNHDGVHWSNLGQTVVKNLLKAKGQTLGYW